MSSQTANGKPKLTEFVAAFGGPPATEYRGGALKVIAAIIYSDGVLIEWLADPVPDLTWMPEQMPTAERTAFLEKFQEHPETVERLRRLKRLANFWDSTTLSDDVGSEYQWAWGDANSVDGSGYKGHEAFGPRSPVQAQTLTVHVHDVAITISLRPR